MVSEMARSRRNRADFLGLESIPAENYMTDNMETTHESADLCCRTRAFDSNRGLQRRLGRPAKSPNAASAVRQWIAHEPGPADDMLAGRRDLRRGSGQSVGAVADSETRIQCHRRYRRGNGPINTAPWAKPVWASPDCVPMVCGNRFRS